MFLFVFLVGKSGSGYFKIQLYPPTVFLIFLYVKSRVDLVCETVREFSFRSRTREGSTKVLERPWSVGENRANISPKTNFQGKAHFLKSKPDSYSFTNSVFHCILFSQELTYKIKSFTSDISDREKQRQIFKQAFDLWSGATNLRIKEDRSSADKDVDIQISFEIGCHNDDYPFDGPGGVLAHAFYPPADNNSGEHS